MTELLQAVNDFHFLRPGWLFALIPLAILLWALRLLKRSNGAWAKVIDSNLLPFLLDESDNRQDATPLILLAISWLLATLALAGPTWSQLPQPVEQKIDSLVIVLDLSDSMNSEDLSPSRIARAKHKLTDILEKRQEGLTALVVYAGGAHTVTPLTDDITTIALMVTSLDPSIMPVKGSDVSAGIELAAQLLAQASQTKGRILLISDGINENLNDFGTFIDGNNITLSILGIGTAAGAPIPTADGGFIKDAQGAIVIPKLNSNQLRQAAQKYGGYYATIRFDDRDINQVLEAPYRIDTESEASDRQFDVWTEQGPYLILLLLPLAALAFRRGWLNSVVLAVSMGLFATITPQTAEANWWDSLWKNRDQQGLEAYKSGDYEAATDLFKRPDWQGNSHYRGQEYEQAINTWKEINTSAGHYNRGNALARSGELDAAIEAYDRALQLDSNNDDASANKALIEELKKQEEKKEQEQEQEQDGEDQNQQGEQSEQNDSKQSDSNQDQSDQEPQDSEKNSQDSQKNPEESEQKTQDTKQEDSRDAEKDEEQQSQSQQQQAQEQQEREQKEQQTKPIESQLNSEEQQAMEQWLRRIPDDPSGLLRKKFLYQSQRNLKQKTHEQQW